MVYLQSVAAQRPTRSDKPAIRLTPNKGPFHQPSLPDRDSTDPLPPPNHPPPGSPPPHDDTFSPSARLPEGNTDESSNESGEDRPEPIPNFEKSDSWLAESKWAANDRTRVKTASELPPTHQWNIVDTLTKQEGKDLKSFKDAMYTALAKVHETANGSKLRIKVPSDIVDNISYSFARARMLNPDLAKRTESFFVEWPNQLFTVAVPTDFELKKPWTSQGNCKYAFYHKTDWANVPKILSERLVRPADWTRDSDGVPQQFPCYGPFGMTCEVHSVKAPLGHQPACQLSNRIFKIGKCQLNAGIIGFFQCPEMTKHSAGGNDQVKRGAMLTGGSKNDHAAVARSDILTVAYVATTQNLPHHLIKIIKYDYRAKDTAPHPDPPPEQPGTATSKPSSRSRHSASGRADDTRSTHWNASKGSRRRFWNETWRRVQIEVFSTLPTDLFTSNMAYVPVDLSNVSWADIFRWKIICGFFLDSWRGAKPKTPQPFTLSQFLCFDFVSVFLGIWHGAKPNTPLAMMSKHWTHSSCISLVFLLSW